MNNKPLVEIKNLNVTIDGSDEHLLKNINFSLGHETVGIVGESGSGKSMLAKAILGLLPENLLITAEKFNYLSFNLLDSQQIKNLRGKEIGLILQDPMHALNPLLTIGYQISEMYQTHTKLDRQKIYDSVIQSLKSVSLLNPEKIYRQYPHELSGGMAQRAMIAMMTAVNPTLLIADEPTSSLDKLLEDDILMLLQRKLSAPNQGLILISHNLPLVAKYCNRIVILHKGEIVEIISKEQLFESTHPYTKKLLHAIPEYYIREQESLEVISDD